MRKFTQPSPAQGKEIDRILKKVFETKDGGVIFPDALWYGCYNVDGNANAHGKSENPESQKALNDITARWTAIIGHENVKLKAITIKTRGYQAILLYRADAEIVTLKPNPNPWLTAA